MGVISGHPSALREKAVADLVNTVQPVRLGRAAADVVAHSHVEIAATDAVEALSTTTSIVATAHVARVGDIIRLTSGAVSGFEATVVAVAANSITLGQELPSAPAAAVTFQILRHRSPTLGPGGSPGSIGASAITTESTVSVAASSTSLLTANANRVGGWVTNVGDVEICVSLSGTATTAKPTKLAVGASLSLSGPGWVYTGAVAAISLGGTGSADVVEL